MKKLNRKQFIQLSTLASGALLVPKFLHSLNSPGLLLNQTSQNILIVIQLGGGNDGLNTFVPFENDIYYNLRPGIGIKPDSLIRVSDEMGLNPGMKSLERYFKDGDICVVNNVGYPNPNHSHFRSMDIWQTASSSTKYVETGWVGRYLDATCADCNKAHMALEVDDSLSLAMKGQYLKGLAMSNPARLYAASQDPYFKSIVNASEGKSYKNNIQEYLYKTLIETSDSIGYIFNQSKIYDTTEVYPATGYGNGLKMIGRLICSGSETKVYYVTLNGFDTHSHQKNSHEKLLKFFSDGLAALINDLKKNDRFNNTLIMAFSEFGRRVEQNGSNGTDHGEANNVILAGGQLKKKGFYNKPPDLANLSDGNLKFEVDFRNIYATILDKWMKADDVKIIGNEFEKMDFI